MYLTCDLYFSYTQSWFLVSEKSMEYRNRDKSYRDWDSVSEKPFNVGKKLLQRQGGHRNWKVATMIEAADAPRSYIVQCQDGTHGLLKRTQKTTRKPLIYHITVKRWQDEVIKSDVNSTGTSQDGKPVTIPATEAVR